MRVHHIALRTRRLGALVAFYGRVLGLAVVRDSAPRSVWMGLEDAVLMIEAASDHEPEIPRGSLELVAFAVTPPARATLREHLVTEGLLEAETEHTLYFRDPDGRRVGVSSYPL